jgi:predicted amidophosphoribosyltransferase
MTPRYCIKATIPERGEDMQLCPICHKETKKSDNSCPGCGYKFPALNTRRSRLHHDSLISFPHSADSITGKESIFL